MVEHNIGKRAFSLPKNFIPVTKSRLKSLELENQEMKSTICALNSQLADTKKILADNQPLVSTGAQLSKLKSINKRLSSLSAGRFYVMSQVLILKALPQAICLGGGLILGCLLESIGINDNKIISGIPNYIPSPSNLWCVVKKSCETTFMSIAGFVCNYPCRMSCGNGEIYGIGRMVKEIDLWFVE